VLSLSERHDLDAHYHGELVVPSLLLLVRFCAVD
jgi:hypothetical protein